MATPFTDLVKMVSLCLVLGPAILMREAWGLCYHQKSYHSKVYPNCPITALGFDALNI